MQQKPKLLEQVREVARARHLSHKTEDVYHNFIKRFILFHDKKHPKDMGADEITAFLTHLAVKDKFQLQHRIKHFSHCFFYTEMICELIYRT